MIKRVLAISLTAAFIFNQAVWAQSSDDDGTPSAPAATDGAQALSPNAEVDGFTGAPSENGSGTPNGVAANNAQTLTRVVIVLPKLDKNTLAQIYLGVSVSRVGLFKTFQILLFQMIERMNQLQLAAKYSQLFARMTQLEDTLNATSTLGQLDLEAVNAQFDALAVEYNAAVATAETTAAAVTVETAVITAGRIAGGTLGAAAAGPLVVTTIASILGIAAIDVVKWVQNNPDVLQQIQEMNSFLGDAISPLDPNDPALQSILKSAPRPRQAFSFAPIYSLLQLQNKGCLPINNDGVNPANNPLVQWAAPSYACYDAANKFCAQLGFLGQTATSPVFRPDGRVSFKCNAAPDGVDSHPNAAGTNVQSSPFGSNQEPPPAAAATSASTLAPASRVLNTFQKIKGNLR